MKRPKGPDLKLPELKAPAFLVDLYHDLRDRRLLPLVALVLVAIVATPILLGQKSETVLPPIGAGPIAVLKATSDKKSAELTVVQANPGLRDYHKRLRDRKPTDPFRQTSAGGGSEGGAAGSTASSSESANTTSTSFTTESTSSTTTTGTSPSTGSPEGAPTQEGGSSRGGGSSREGGGSTGGGGSQGGNGGEVGGKPQHATLYSFGIDVTIIHSSGSKAEDDKQTSEPETRKRVLPTTSLPGEKKQVVTYMGLSPARRPLFLVSTDVTGVFGEGKCVTGSDSCQLIELEPGFPEVFEYGEGGDRYSIKVTKIEFIVTGHV